jgi:hypothetical protein
LAASASWRFIVFFSTSIAVPAVYIAVFAVNPREAGLSIAVKRQNMSKTAAVGSRAIFSLNSPMGVYFALGVLGGLAVQIILLPPFS